MEQRRLRLGDILDDYCPRERRVTNHAIVAMVEEDVKQTRCTTCDSEHAYKGGKEPRRRKKDATAVLYEEVLAGMPEATEAVHLAAPAPTPVVLAAPEPDPVIVADTVPPSFDDGPGPIDDPVVDELPADEEPRTDADDGPFHRRLIRATLPRPEGQKEVRQVPEFTIRQNSGRSNGHGPNGFRAKMRGHGGNGTGNRPQGGGRRFGGGTPGERSGRPGFGAGNPQRARNRKRSR
jgi:hypothetical protein